MTWYGQEKWDDFLKDLDSHFQKLQIANFDIFNSKTNLPATKLKEYRTVKHSEVLAYSKQEQDEILSSIFRTKRDNMFVKNETIYEHFKKPVKSFGRGRFVQENRDLHYKVCW